MNCFLTYSGAAFNTGDLKVFFVIPAGATYIFQVLGYNAGGSSPGNDVSRLSFANGTTHILSTEGAGNLRGVSFLGTLTTVGTSGTVQVQEAQNTASGTDTIVGVGSNLRLQRIS